MSTQGFVQLDRLVLELGDQDEEDVELRVARSLVLRTWGLSSLLMTWDELLAKSRHAVVLGEPGAGKTWELFALAERLVARGVRASFVRLELLHDDRHLALQDVDLVQADEHLLLLDALDETKLESHNPLERCLRALREASGAAWPRLRLVVSCRVSDWQPGADGATLRRLLPKNPTSDVDGVPVRVVGLAPLTGEQVSALARAKGVASPEAFRRALEAAGASGLCGRPRDVVELAEYWNRHGKLGRLGEVLEDNLARKLGPPIGRAEPAGLSLEEARRGAEALAAAMTLGRTFTIRLPDEEAEVSTGAGALDPVQAIPDWPPDKIRALLSRPVFDEATLGRVRFHHRIVLEYLAACWVQRLLQQGCPRRAVERLFVSRVVGREVLLPCMAPVAAWLVAWDSLFAGLVIRHAPHVLLQGGDPRALPIEVRQRVLEEYALRYHDHLRLPSDGGRPMLAQFADEALSPLILRLLEEHASNEDLCTKLMRLAASGPLRGCGEAAAALAVDGTRGLWVQLLAIDMVVELASPPHVGRLLRYLEEEPAIAPRVVHELWRRLFPVHLTVEKLLESLRRHRGVAATGPTTASSFVLENYLIPNCPTGQIVTFMTGLRAMVQETERGNARAWLATGLARALLRALRELPSSPDLVDEVLTIFDLLREIERRDPEARSATLGHSWHTDVHQAVERHGDLRRAFFWRRHEDAERLLLWRLEPLRLGQRDLEWVVQDLQGVGDPRRRRIALIAAVTLVAASPEGVDRVRRAVADSADLTATLEDMLRPREAPPPSEYELERRRRAEREQAEIASDRERLTRRLDSLRTGTEEAVYCDLVDRYRGASSRRSDLAWARMEEHLGLDVVQAAQAGLALWWQGYEAPARGGDSQATLGVVMALVGLERFFALGGRATDLAPVAARRAAVVATWELNEVPAWLDQVAEAYPDTVREVLLQAIRAGLHDAQDHSVLGKVAHRAGAALSVVAPHLVGLLAERETSARQSLEVALRLVTARPEDHAAMAAILPARVSASQGEPTHLPWLVAWLAIDADAALDWIERQAVERGEAEADRFVVELLAFVHERGFPLGRDSSVFRPRALARMVDLAYRRMRRVQDEDSEGPRPVSRRDNAQQGRSAFLHALGAQETEAAYRALVELAGSDSVTRPSEREWITGLAERVAERLAEGLPWTPAQVVELARSSEAPPRTAGDLFQIAGDRLDDLAVRQEGGDFSVRELFRPDDPESTVQKWLAGELERAARGRYCVTREPEVDLAKKPDIRLANPGFAGPVTIEVKVADRWSYPQLEASLREQLVGQYLRANDSRHGILFLAHLDGGHHWEPNRGERIDFDEVLRRLDLVARDLEASERGVERLRVVGVRLCRPAGTSPSAATRRRTRT